jgi:uncharacterized membrane protein
MLIGERQPPRASRLRKPRRGIHSPMRAAERNGGVAGVVQEVAERVGHLARLERELATIELRRKLASLGGGAALVVAAALLSLFAVGFVLATVAAALATFLPVWVALLAVALGLALVAGATAALGVRLLRRGTPPLPEQALAEAKATGAALRGSAHG